MYLCQGHGYSYLCSAGPGPRIYWFLFSKAKQTTYGLYEKLPRFTNADRDALAAEHFKDKINDKLTFKDLWDNSEQATMTALPECVFSKWHYGRIMTVGDAAHKVS